MPSHHGHDHHDHANHDHDHRSGAGHDHDHARHNHAPDVSHRTPGVAQVSHVHVWSITSGRPAATLNVRLAPGADPALTTQAVKAYLRDSYGIGHATVEIDWGQGADLCALGPDSKLQAADAVP